MAPSWPHAWSKTYHLYNIWGLQFCQKLLARKGNDSITTSLKEEKNKHTEKSYPLKIKWINIYFQDTETRYPFPHLREKGPFGGKGNPQSKQI